MMQQKKGTDQCPYNDLKEAFRSLDYVQQESVTNYFHLHNVSAWIYENFLNSDAQAYVNLCIKYSLEENVESENLTESEE